MILKKGLSVLLVLGLLLSTSACDSGSGSSSSAAAPESQGSEVSADGTPAFDNVKISAGSGTAGGGQYVYVGGITNIINSNLPGVEIILEATKGSGENLALLQSGDMDIASIESSIAYNAMIGEDLADGEQPFPEIRCMFSSLPTHFIATTLDQEVTNVEQFSGEIVAFGPYTGSTDISSRAVFEALGLIDSFEVLNAGWGDCFTAMGEGQVYAVTGSSIHPSSAITELEATQDVNFVPLTQEQMDLLMEVYPYYKSVTLEQDTYQGLTEDYQTIGAWQAMYTRADLDEDLVYMLTKTVFEHLDLLESTHPGGFTTRLENIGEQPVPLHMGAYRYYQEMGIEVPEELLPPELQQ